ncbi:MAG: hypothetical protein A3F96_02380 [Parcubacteria group bacterium RIFCSPLOWO2_12_FULL_40_10]|nr:MAG: hypothetical protein A3F96_02380 [Parcubacteria group bacterium RIFCSPLOWO2_12_FULL_40_10]
MTTDHQIDLGAMLDAVVGKSGTPSPTKVKLDWTAIPEVLRTNIALQNMGEDERLEFLKVLLDHWRGAWYNASDRESHMVQLRKVFGENTHEDIGSRLLYTLTADGRQFRCWNGIPGRMTKNHVDSCGASMVLEVVGEPTSINKYMFAILPHETRLNVVQLPNGTMIYGFHF